MFVDDSAGGKFEIQATIRTDDGVYTATRSVTVANVEPVLQVAGKSSIAEGDRYTLYLLASDPGADTISNWTVNWGDDSQVTVAGSAKTISHLYADNGNYSIMVTATDEDSGEGQPYQASQVAWLDRPVYSTSMPAAAPRGISTHSRRDRERGMRLPQRPLSSAAIQPPSPLGTR